MPKLTKGPSSDPWKIRTTRVVDVDPRKLLNNPHNYRIHPENQKQALDSAIHTIGFIDPIKAQEGTDLVIDGHLRVALAIRDEMATIPVQYLDLDEDEALFALATLDPLSAMAQTDDDLLHQLIGLIDTDDVAILELLDHHQSFTSFSFDPNSERDHGSDPIALEHEAEDENKPVEKGMLLELVKVTIDEPRHECHLGQVWRLGDRHHLCVVHPFHGWPVYVPLLTPESWLLTLPGPMALMTEEAKAKPFVLVQNSLYTAGHILDRWTNVFGADSAVMIASHAG